jgi:hypothetical protein
MSQAPVLPSLQAEQDFVQVVHQPALIAFFAVFVVVPSNTTMELQKFNKNGRRRHPPPARWLQTAFLRSAASWWTTRHPAKTGR